MGRSVALVRAAIDMGIEHPVFGGGRGSFRVELPRWAVRRMAQEPDSAPLSLVLVAVPVSIVAAKAPGAITATCLAVSWTVSSVPARRVLEREP